MTPKEKKIVSISQPAYLPWSGYIERIALSDLHVVLDHVQLEKRSFTARNKIRTADGWKWLTVPLLTKGRNFDLPINTIEVKNDINWRKDHLMTLQNAYAKTPHFAEHKSFFQNFYDKDWTHLQQLCAEQLSYLLSVFEIKTPLISSSKLSTSSSKSALILDLCKEVGCTTYISGPFGRDYLELAEFDAAGIDVKFHDYNHPTYKQRWEPFLPFMSSIDLLFNCGSESNKILKTTDTSVFFNQLN